MDALTIRGQVLHSGLSMELQKLSAPALLLAMEKPLAWRGRLFIRIFSDKILDLSYLKDDFDYHLTLNRSVRLRDRDIIIEWVNERIEELLMILNSVEVIITTVLPNAVNRQSDSIEDIIYASDRLAKAYQRILEWGTEFRHTQVDIEFHHLMELFSQIMNDAIKAFEAFPSICDIKIDEAIKQHNISKQPQLINFELAFPDLDTAKLIQEICRIKAIPCHQK